MNICPEHNCPLIPIGDRDVCLLEHARSLLGLPVTDLIVAEGRTTLVFPGEVLPLVGWNGNAKAAASAEDADALLEVLDEMYLVAAEHSDEQTITLHLADHPGGIEDGQWMLSLRF